jgi:hypothetical protein
VYLSTLSSPHHLTQPRLGIVCATRLGERIEEAVVCVRVRCAAEDRPCLVKDVGGCVREVGSTKAAEEEP